KVLVKHPSSWKIYGGYNPMGFTSNNNGWRQTTESFIFSCEGNGGNLQMSRVRNNYASYAIYDYYDRGFDFGNTFYMMGQNIHFNCTGYYEDNVINSKMNSTYFTPEEIEVFRITIS